MFVCKLQNIMSLHFISLDFESTKGKYRVSKNVLFRVSEKYLKYQINNEPNYNTFNRMFDMCSSYCENFIYISLSIAMWHGIFNPRLTKLFFMGGQRGQKGI